MTWKIRIDDQPDNVYLNRIDINDINRGVDLFNICCGIFFDDELDYNYTDKGYNLFFATENGKRFLLQNATSRECFLFLQGMRYYHNNGNIMPSTDEMRQHRKEIEKKRKEIK
jgi:hypothetical protein|tara:strand:- start:911 stop:1249 length:339 start_codon:yes stop_codon:yes gene_type:complete